MILNTVVVEQAVDIDEKDHFVKEIVLARGAVPIAMVRKRLADIGSSPAEDANPAEVARPTKAAVLMIHGYGQNRYAFHLPSRSFVNHLARAGFDVYNVDLRGRGRSGHLGAKRARGVEDFIREDVPAALDEICRISGERPIFLVGHSLGGVIGYGVAVDRPGQIAGVITLGSPYHFTLGSRLLAGVAEAFLMLDRAVDLPNVALPLRMYGSLVRAGTRVFDSRLYPIPIRGFRRGATEPHVLRQHMALAMDSGSVSTMRAMFSWAKEIRTRVHDDDRALFGYAQPFEALDIPLLVIAGKHDDLAPPASVLPAYERSRARDRTYRELPFGHIDLLVGREAPLLTWPLVESWLTRRATRSAEPRTGEAA